jgi:hypothetical protein
MGAERRFWKPICLIWTTSHKLGRSRQNELIVKVLVHLDEIDFDLENTDSDVLAMPTNI